MRNAREKVLSRASIGLNFDDDQTILKAVYLIFYYLGF